MAHMAEDQKEFIHQIHAQHSSKHARKHPSTAFNGLRSHIDLVRGCKGMITRNIAYLYGLANGARGKILGVVYPPNTEAAAFPEAIVMGVPDYCGPTFYDGEPAWVPILPCTALKQGTRMIRTQFPIVAGFALAVIKAQGLAIEEGAVINLRGSARFRPASKHVCHS